MKARQLIINDMIEEARKQVISSDLELNFLLRIQKKIEKGEIKFKHVELLSLDNIKKQSEIHKENYNYYLERLNYLKELREFSKAEKIQAIVEKTTASTLNVNISQ